MIECIEMKDKSRHVDDMMAMHRLRYRVFHERLRWEVTISGDMEMDEYDMLDGCYLLHRDAAGGIDGCVRLLPTLGPYMLKNTFPVLCQTRPIPMSGHAWEASRFSVDVPVSQQTSKQNDRSMARGGVHRVTSELFAAMVEKGLALGLDEIVAVVDLRMERILRMAGWPLARYDAPRPVGITMAVAGGLAVSAESLAAIRAVGGLEGPVLIPHPQALAAQGRVA